MTDDLRNRQLIRVLRLARRVEDLQYPVALVALANEFSVSTRTIRRDLLALETAGWPVPTLQRSEEMAIPHPPHVAHPRVARMVR